MAFPHERHDDALKLAVGQAIMEGQRATDVVRALAAGTFHDFGKYELPVPTARYYGQQARKREAAMGLTTRAKGDLDEAITQMAREILSELDHELKAVRARKTRDLEKLGTITKGLKDLRGLIVAAGKPNTASKPTQKPVDPFLASLGKTSTARASTPSQKKEEQTSRPGTASQREAGVAPTQEPNHMEVPSHGMEAAVHSVPYIGGGLRS